MKRKLAASLALVAEAIGEVIAKRSTIFGAAFLPMAGIILANAMFANLTPSAFSNTFLLLITLPMYALFATVVHRVVLLGEPSLPNRLGIFWTERETRFLVWLVGILLLNFALSLPTAILSLALSEDMTGWNSAWIAIILGYILIAYFHGRFSLVLPATATDRHLDFRESWAMSRGKGMMIATALVLPAMLPLPIEWVLYGLLGDSLMPVADLLWILLTIPILAVEVAIISLVFDKLSFRGR
ncbi:MAG: hypothetical protein AAFV47_11055 [Pseudomonadota bacterium]